MSVDLKAARGSGPEAVELEGEEALVDWAARLAQVLPVPCVVYLEGNLGAGKTTLCKGLLRGLGHPGAVKSPTYNLVEPYELGDLSVYHFDLYRLTDAEELEFLGIRDYFGERTVALIEWPERGQPLIPAADLTLRLESVRQGEARRVTWEGSVDLTTIE